MNLPLFYIRNELSEIIINEQIMELVMLLRQNRSTAKSPFSPSLVVKLAYKKTIGYARQNNLSNAALLSIENALFSLLPKGFQNDIVRLMPIKQS